MAIRYRFGWELSTMTRAFARNFIHSSMIARRGTPLPTTCHSIAELGSKMLEYARNENGHWYEKASTKLVGRRKRSREYGRLRSDKETGAAGQGGCSRFAFRSKRVGFALCR